MQIEIAPLLPALGAGPVGAIVFGVIVVAQILGTLFGGVFGGTDWNAINAAITQLRNQLSGAIDEVGRFAWSIAYALGKLLGAIKDIWISFIDQLWSLLKRIWQKLVNIIQAVLPQIVQALKNLKKWLDWIYVKILRPILNYIQILRRYLYILRLMHLKIATRLDGILTRIQGRIIGPYLYVLRMLNGYGGWINVILTGGLTLQRPLLINTLYQYQADWINLWWTAQQGSAGSLSGSSGASSGGAPTRFQVEQEFAQYVQLGSGPVKAQGLQAQAAFASWNQSA
jgi:hypothetical protein